MDNSKEKKTLIVIVGAIILGVFISISMINMSDNDRYLSTNVVKRVDYVDGKLIVTTRDDMVSVCVKQTKSEPSLDSLCWIDTVSNEATVSIYEYTTYHIWTKDTNDIISYYNEYNTQDDNG